MELADTNQTVGNVSKNSNESGYTTLQQKLMDHGENHMRIDHKLDNMNAINEDTYQKGTEALANLQMQGKKIDDINQNVQYFTMKLEEITIKRLILLVWMEQIDRKET